MTKYKFPPYDSMNEKNQDSKGEIIFQREKEKEEEIGDRKAKNSKRNREKHRMQKNTGNTL
jgi:hypothetical protein